MSARRAKAAAIMATRVEMAEGELAGARDGVISEARELVRSGNASIVMRSAVAYLDRVEARHKVVADAQCQRAEKGLAQNGNAEVRKGMGGRPACRDEKP
jgi:CHASE3 domain sensor protein